MDRNALIVVALLAAVGAAVWLNERRIRRARRSGVPLQGFGGWLLLLAVIVVVEFLGFAGLLGTMLAEDETWMGNHSPRVIQFQAPVIAATTCLLFWLCILMFRKKQLFPRVFRIHLVVMWIMPVLMALLEAASLGSARVPLSVSGVEVVGTTLGTVLWWVYSVRSIRVRNTFTR
jgi:hypothetical protein